MTLFELLEKANRVYDSGFLAEYYDKKGGLKSDGVGDTLAKFIVIELIETFDPAASTKAQLAEAARVMRMAQFQITAVADELEDI